MNQKTKWLSVFLVLFLAINIGIIIIYVLSSSPECIGPTANLAKQDIIGNEIKLSFDDNCKCGYCNITNQGNENATELKLELIVGENFIEELFSSSLQSTCDNQEKTIPECSYYLEPNKKAYFRLNENFSEFVLKASSREAQTTAYYKSIDYKPKSNTDYIIEHIIISLIGTIIFVSLILYFKNKE